MGKKRELSQTEMLDVMFGGFLVHSFNVSFPAAKQAINDGFYRWKFGGCFFEFKLSYILK